MLDMPFQRKITKLYFICQWYTMNIRKKRENIYSLCKNFQANQWRDADEAISRMSRQCFISGWPITKILLHIHFGHIQIVLLVNISPASSLLLLPILYWCLSELGGGERTHKGTCTTVRTGSATWDFNTHASVSLGTIIGPASSDLYFVSEEDYAHGKYSKEKW